MNNLLQVFGWAVCDFFTEARFYLEEESETSYSYRFVHKDDEKTEFEFSIADDETELTLTAKVREVINLLCPEDQRVVLLADWRMLAERFRILDGSEDAFTGEEIEDDSLAYA